LPLGEAIRHRQPKPPGHGSQLVEDFETLMETLDVLADPAAMKTFQSARNGQSTYRQLEGFNRLRVGGIRLMHHQISGNEIRLEYANTRDAVYELYQQILENRGK
jgi:hypothetical protein